MANAAIPNKTLRIGVVEALYSAAGGAFNTTGTAGTAPNGTFQLPPQSSNYRGQLSILCVPVGGTVTTATFQLEASMNPQGAVNINGVGASAFDIVNKVFGVSAAPSTLTAYSGLAAIATATPVVVVLDVSGLAGGVDLRLNFTTVTLGSGSGFDVYASIA